MISIGRYDKTYVDNNGVEKDIPDEYLGFWMMEYPTCLQYETMKDCIKGFDWVKCKPVEVMVTKWEESE